MGTAVTLAFQPFPIFKGLSIQQSFTLNKVQYLAVGDFSKITWFQGMMAQ
jgi:hypothetical protein